MVVNHIPRQIKCGFSFNNNDITKQCGPFTKRIEQDIYTYTNGLVSNMQVIN